MNTEYKPIRVSIGHASVETIAHDLGAEVIADSIDMQIEELFLIRNPAYKFNPDYATPLEQFKRELTSGDHLHYGEWFYFPWRRTLAHVLPKKEWYELRTARNRDLITSEEQERFARMTIAIAGLSVGSHIAITVAQMGGAHRMVLADPDTLGPSNLNRIRASICEIGTNKAILSARLITEFDPYAEVTVLTKGVEEGNIGAFFDLAPIDLLIEETDKLSLKIALREEARKRRIPVVMGTDNGDGIILDVERYDLHSNLQLFNGAIGDVDSKTFADFPRHELPKLATRIAGPELAEERMKDSILRVGKTLYSWPQLGDAATLCGVAVAFIARRIANDLPVQEGKFGINLDRIIDPDYDTDARKHSRSIHHKEFMHFVGLDTP